MRIKVGLHYVGTLSIVKVSIGTKVTYSFTGNMQIKWLFSSWMRTCCYMSIAYKLMLTWVTTYNVIRPYGWSKAHTNSFIVTYWLIRSRSTSSTSTRSKKGSEAKPFRPGCIPQSSCIKVIKIIYCYIHANHETYTN